MARKYKSRTAKLEEAMEPVCGAKDQVEELKDELQNWHDNQPENLQGSTKAEQLEEAITALEKIVDNLENACNTAEAVEFPGMY